jgi:hypothetical protein
MGLFNRKKKETPFNYLKQECKTHNIPISYFYGWHNHIGNPTLSKEVVDEFINRPHLLYKTELPVTLSLPESDNKIRGGMLGGDGFVSSSRQQVKVKCKCYFADKGIVFIKAINESKDLRLSWDDIADCENVKKQVDIICDGVVYTVKFQSVDTAILFAAYVNEHMKGSVDDGWS